jgi:ElaB/YqjD/DUF883 family membrane-anchored ribosome-binding protein
MSSADFQAEGSAAHAGNTNANSMGERVGDAYSQASTLARDASEKVKQTASETASTVTDQVKELLDRQIGTGATMAGQFASSARLAANDLDQQAPMLAGLVRNFANKVESYSGDLQHQTVDQLARAASDFTRRQPTLVFGLAALAGFLMFRTAKSTNAVSSPPLQPTHPGATGERQP